MVVYADIVKKLGFDPCELPVGIIHPATTEDDTVRENPYSKLTREERDLIVEKCFEIVKKYYDELEKA